MDDTRSAAPAMQAARRVCVLRVRAAFACRVGLQGWRAGLAYVRSAHPDARTSVRAVGPGHLVDELRRASRRGWRAIDEPALGPLFAVAHFQFGG